MGILSHLSKEERNLILKTVEYHNRLEISECSKNSKELLFYLKLIRDADKLDILRITSETYEEGKIARNPVFEHYLPDTGGCSETIIKDILNKKMAKIIDVRNINDLKLLRLSLIYDLNFPASLAILKEHKYLSTVISSMAELEEMTVIKRHFENYLDEAEIAFPNRVNKP
jgi:hypothetical protein